MTYKILYINKKPYLKDVFFNDIKERYNIFVATSYNEAINIIASTGIDILLCQINLDKAGYDFLKSAELVSSATIKLLIVEPADQKNSLSYLDELNIFQVIFTPFDPRLIEFNLKNALEHLQLRNTNKILFNRLSLNKNKLEEKIAERTEELERINKELQEANTLKNKLFSIISHDLMAPIYSFNIFIDVILKYNDNISFNEIKDYCFKIREYIDNVEKMIESLLKWSSFQIYKADLNNNKINLKDIIEELNYQILKNANGENFITFFVAIYDRQSKSLKYVNAGHNPPFLINKNFTGMLETGSTILGNFDPLPFLEVGHIKKLDDFFFFAYTDGVTETFNENQEEFGIERLKEFIFNNYQKDLKQMHKDLLQFLNDFKGNNSYKDDITYISCKLR